MCVVLEPTPNAVSFPDTKSYLGIPSLFAGIPMIPPVILGNQSKIELLDQEKEIAAGRMSGNEQLGNNSLRKARCTSRFSSIAFLS